MKYRSLKNWKYQLLDEVITETPIIHFSYRCEFFEINTDGMLAVRRGYCWDGPSGPTWDSPGSLRPSLVHDVLYQMLRDQILPQHLRAVADEVFYNLMKYTGMGKIRAWYFYKAVRLFGGRAAAVTHQTSSEVLTAP